jgi:glycosyltransferase involved in cell wall biosynthesis
MSAMPHRIVYLLMTYNQEAFVAAAVQSALAQAYEPLEIWISDDCSDDSTFEIIRREVAHYSGPHKVNLNRNPQRLGSVEHLATIAATIGHDAFYVTAHGDDVAHQNRTEVQVQAWRETTASMVTCAINWLDGWDTFQTGSSSRFIGPEEIIKGWLPEMLGATLAFDAQILSAFPPLSAQALSSGLDHVLPLRAAAMNGLYFVAEKLIDYRVHASNMSRKFRDKTQSSLVRDERHAAYELALGKVQSADMWKLARSNMLSLRHWRLVFKMHQKQRFRCNRLEKLRKSLSAQSPQLTG